MSKPSVSRKERDLFSGRDAAVESLRVIAKLVDAGFVAYLAGGCVRDALLDREPKDFDVATNATPNSVREIFGKRRTLAFGASFGVIGVLPPKTKPSSSQQPSSQQSSDSHNLIPTEVATFRSDGDYSDGRRPDSVHFGSAEEDALRRDFTINGMFYDPVQRSVIDFVGGKADLEKRVLRTIGNPADRFDEDKLRMLRAVRIATVLQLHVDDDTLAAIQAHASMIQIVSGERIGAEMRKVLGSHDVATGLRWLRRCDLEQSVFPEMAGIDVDNAGLTLVALEHRDVSTSLACLLRRHSDCMAALGAVTRRWKLSNEERRRCRTAMQYADTILQANELPWSKVQPIVIDRDRETVLQVAKAITLGEGRPTGGVDLVIEAVSWPSEKLDPAPLLTGDDLRHSGFTVGPIFQTILSEVRRAQLDGEITTSSEAMRLARNMVERKS